jgi:flagellar motility protein MotE (MotC chaperone)
MRLKPRLLHLLIAAASVMLVARVGAAWHDVGVAFAQTPPTPAPAAQSAQAKPTSETPAKPASETPAKEAAAAPAGAAPTPAPAADAEPLNPGAPKAPAPTTYSDAEVKLLQDLAKRRTELDQRADELTQRETLLKAAEQRVDEKIDQLKQMQATVDASLGKVDAQEDQRLTSLVAIYTNMKPKEAAPILSELDMPVLLQLLTRMKDRTTSAIMAAMDPKKAEAITVALAQRRQTTGAASADAAANPQN